MTTTLTLVCPKCGKDNPSEAKRCRNHPCQAWIIKLPPLSEEHKQKIRSAQIGIKRQPLSEDHKQKISKALKGRPGMPCTEETKQKLSKANKGRKLPHSDEWNQKISLSLLGKEVPQEQRDKISATLSTPEAKERSRKLFMEHAQHLGNTPEAKEKKSETHKRLRKENPDKYWGGGYLGHKPYSFETTGKRRSSKVERSLKPCLEPLGFIHSEDKPVRVVLNGKVKFPDYYNPKTRQIVEVLGTYWHRDRILPEGKKHQTSEELIAWYKESDWDCIVIWENEVDTFIESLREVA